MTSYGAWVAIFIAVIGGMAGFAAVIKVFLERPKFRAEAMTLVTSAATGQLETQQRDNVDVRARLAAVERKLEDAVEKLNRADDKIDELQDKLRVSDQQNALLRTQNRILLADARKVREWAEQYYEAGHPPGAIPPPPGPPFDETLP